jgi:hypothetical protein
LILFFFFFKIEFITIAEPLERSKREFVNDDELEQFYRQYRQWKDDQLPIDIDYLSDNSTFKMSFDDTFYRKQWYLVSLNIEKFFEIKSFFLFLRKMKVK